MEDRNIITMKRMTDEPIACTSSRQNDQFSQLEGSFSSTRRSWTIPRSIPFTSVILLVLVFFLQSADASGDKCNTCRFLVETFRNGLKKTEKMHFAGGNTDWEERNLGKFAKSETRLVEVMEHVCKNKDLPSGLEGLLDTGKDTEHRCQSLVEEHEETIEQWYFHKQTSYPDFVKWLCIESLRFCCPDGTFGPKCDACPGDSTRPCFGRGKCQGEGTRTGSGKCKCETGYIGNVCRKCDTNYFIAEQNDTFVDCRKCDDACKGGCKFAGPIGCFDCKPGWKFDSVKGCEDINECEEDPCQEDGHEKCVNSPGSFECVCVEGYRKEDGKCVIDVIEKPLQNDTSTDDASGENATVPDPEPIPDDKVEL